MGLDMYLHKRIYVGNQHRERKVKVIIPDNDDALFPIKSINENKISSIIEDAAYWRKANQIHKWFVDNVQKGVDDCGEYYVTKENLKTLISLCRKDIKTIEKGGYSTDNINLKPQSGFFFGSTDIDKYFVEDLKDTIDQLEPLLKEEGDFYYTSSW